MLANFDELITKDNAALPIPKEVLEALNLQLPEGLPFQYADLGGGKCRLVPIKPLEDIEMRVQMKGVRILDAFPAEIKTQEDIMDYMYRTQTPVHGEIVHGNTPQLFINNIPIDMDKMGQDPFEDVKTAGNYQVVISPPPFPEIPPLKLEAAGYTMELPAKRVPYEEKDTLRIQTDESYWVTVDMIVPLKTNKVNVTWSADYKKCASVQEYIQALKMTNAMAEGKGKLMDMPTDEIGGQPSHAEEYIAFWEDAAKVEEALGVSFLPSFNLQNGDVADMNRLVRCFVEKRPMKRMTTEGSDWKLTVTSSPDQIRDAVGQPIVVSYTEEAEWDLLGAKFKTISQNVVLGAVFDEIIEEDTDDDQCRICLKPADGKRMTVASQDFLNQEALELFRSRFASHKEQEEYFSKATALNEK